MGPKNDPPPPAILLGRAERRTHPLSSFCLVGQSGPRRARLLAVNWRRKKTACRGAPFSRRAMRSAQFPAQPQKKAPKFASQSIMAQVLFTWKQLWPRLLAGLLAHLVVAFDADEHTRPASSSAHKNSSQRPAPWCDHASSGSFSDLAAPSKEQQHPARESNHRLKIPERSAKGRSTLSCVS